MRDESTLIDHTIKIGDSAVGKSSIVLRFTEGIFDPQIACTIAIGVDFKLVMHDSQDQNGKDVKVNLSIWDTAGQEKFQSLTPSYYRGAHVILLGRNSKVYDVSKRSSFLHLVKWLDEANLYCTVSSAIKVLIGNKTDLGREVTKDEANQFKRKNNLALFLECSSKEGSGVDEIFTEVINTVLNDNNLEKQTMTNAKKEEITIQQEKQPNPESSICQEC